MRPMGRRSALGAAGCTACALFVLALLIGACGATPEATPAGAGGLRVLAVESFLADIAQNVAGERLRVTMLLPPGVDPHSYEPVPADLAKVAGSNVLIVNGAGLEEFLDEMLANAGGQRLVVDASAGIEAHAGHEHGSDDHDAQAHDVDPHFWLDPNLVTAYVANIRDGLSKADPAGAAVYAANADAYNKRLAELDAWIHQQVDSIPAAQRLLVTNHESLGYFAERYGFTVVGTVLSSVTTSASPSVQDIARLIDQIKASGATAIFVETGANTQLARQIANDTGARLVDGLNTHAVVPDGQTPSYIEMMRQLVTTVVTALRL